MKQVVVNKKAGEQSFTIIETLVALGIMLTVVLEVVGAQGNVAAFANYSRRVTEATWLAKRIMSQVEYHWHQKEFKELENKLEDAKFNLGTTTPADFDYTYNLSIEEWKLPLFDIMMGGGPKTDDEEEEDIYRDPNEDPMQNMLGGMPGIEQVINTVFDGHIMKVAHVEVFWPEGARRNSVTLSYLLTNQRALDAYLNSKAQAFSKMLSEVEKDISGGGGGDDPPPPPPPPPR